MKKGVFFVTVNFEFTNNINTMLYKDLYSAEKNALVDANVSAKKTRDALERLTLHLLRANNAQLSKDQKKLEGYINKCYQTKIITKTTCNKMHQLRQELNHHCHPKSSPTKNKEAVRLLGELHNILLEIDAVKQIAGTLAPFSKEKMMIGPYYPIEDLKVSMYEEGCVRKVKCYSYDEEIKKIYILRQFNRAKKKDDLLTTFLARDKKAIDELNKERLEEVVQLHKVDVSLDNEYIYSCYEAINDELTLNQIDFSQWELQKRLELLLLICRGLKKMHNAFNPIYHRALNPNAIYVGTDRRNNITIRIGNFEYSKIETHEELATVFEKSVNRKQDAFKSPELIRNKAVEDWSKVDVYSFTVLFAYVFEKSIQNISAAIDLLVDEFDNEELLDLLFDGCDTNPKNRPTIDQFESILEEELHAANTM